MRRSKKILAVCLLIVIIGGLGFLAYLSMPCLTKHEYFNEFPNYWEVISVGETSDNIQISFQNALSGDFLGTDEIVTITCHHHGHPGIFINYLDGKEWKRYPIHPYFDPTVMNAWPVKGLASGDLDNDGLPEIITAMDCVVYPPNHPSKTLRPFPGIVYIDPNKSNFTPQPLVWGAWGEKLTSTIIANCYPIITNPKFRSPNNTLPDIFVPTMTDLPEGLGGRIFLLEQPADGFGNYNYTFITENIRGTEPYDMEPFYVKHLYVESNGLYKELVWSPSDVPGASAVCMGGCTDTYLDGDSLMDLVVTGTYMNGDNYVKGRISLYRRVNATNIPSNYVFEEIQTFWIESGCLWEPHIANLDGDIENGKESIVIGYSANGSLVYPYSGLLTLTPEENGNYTLQGITMAQDTFYPYVKIYSKTVIIDANKDGYDDAIIYCREKDSFELNYGDLILFLNCYKNDGYYKVFQYKEGKYRILLNNECISWGLTAQQLDKDEDLEITVCSAVKIPYWCPLKKGEKYAYGLDVIELVTNT